MQWSTETGLFIQRVADKERCSKSIRCRSWKRCKRASIVRLSTCPKVIHNCEGIKENSIWRILDTRHQIVELFHQRFDADGFMTNEHSHHAVLYCCEWAESEENNLQAPMNLDEFLAWAEIRIQCSYIEVGGFFQLLYLSFMFLLHILR